MTDGRRRVLFAPGRVRTSERGPSGIRITPPPSQPPGGQGRGGGQGGGRGTGRGRGAGLANLQQLVAALGAISSTSGKVVPSPPDVPGALTLISTQQPSAGSNISFTSIVQTYSDLVIALIGRSAAVGASFQGTLTVNSDTGANYVRELMNAQGSTVSGAGSATATSFPFAIIPAASATAGYFTYAEITIAGYSSTAFFKNLLCAASATASTANPRVELNSALWVSTAAVTQVDISVSSGFAAGTVARLYGRS